MRTSLLTVLTLAVALCACGATPAAPDPLTQTFIATGPVVNFTPAASAPLTYVTKGQTLTVGTIEAGGTVKISMTAAQAQSVPLRHFSEDVAGYQTLGCDVSTLTVKDTGFRLTDSFAFSVGDVASTLTPQTITANADGTSTRVVSQFWYVVAAGSITGRVTCPGNILNFAVRLAPGWNIVLNSFTTDASGAVLTSFLGGAVSSTTYSGSWYTYRASP